MGAGEALIFSKDSTLRNLYNSILITSIKLFFHRTWSLFSFPSQPRQIRDRHPLDVPRASSVVKPMPVH